MYFSRIRTHNTMHYLGIPGKWRMVRVLDGAAESRCDKSFLALAFYAYGSAKGPVRGSQPPDWRRWETSL